MSKSIYIIGLGKVGTSFFFELTDKGYEVNFVSISQTNLADKIISGNNSVSVSLNIEKDFIIKSDIILICVQDRNLKEVIKSISLLNIDLSEKYFFHTSGSESSELFSYDCFNSNNVVSMHPIQTFDKPSLSNNHLLEKIYFGIEGGNEGKKVAVEITENLNSNYIEIPREKKYLYHSACVISSNFLITLLNISSEIMGSIGIEKSKTFEIFQPIIENTLKNISEDGLINSLTGPFDRNDIETISNHLNSINKELPSLIPFYTLLGMETVKVAFKKESLNLKNVISILDLMNEYIISESANTNKTVN